MKNVIFYGLFFASLLTAFAAATQVGNVGVGAKPGNGDPQICIKSRSVLISPGDFFGFGSGSPTKLGANAPTINVLNLRPGSYAFNGEQIEFLVIVRDPNGAIDIGQAYVQVNGSLQLVCSPEALPADNTSTTEREDTCNGLRPTGNSNLTNGILDNQTDKAFRCTYTVEPTNPDTPSNVSVGVRDASNIITSSIYSEHWIFNPTVSIDVRSSDGQSILFEDAMPGEFAHSLNRIFVENTANKVALWVFIAMTDLFSTSGPVLCPDTNKLDVEGSSANNLTGVYYRARSGTLQTNLPSGFGDPAFPGDNPAEGWAHITNPNTNFDCSYLSILTLGTCSGGRPLFDASFLQPGLPFQLTGWANNVLLPTGLAEVEFKILFPKPCIGNFDDTANNQILVYGKPI
ncbi:MAG: hypothetical protein HYX24_01205 [Candidatus Aenigmarchaeota archaeon]|nr:hypothetical protein [Candidatus Aenigmarchaeota archaeon]